MVIDGGYIIKTVLVGVVRFEIVITGPSLQNASPKVIGNKPQPSIVNGS